MHRIKLEKSLEKFSYWSDRFRQLPLYFMNFYGSVDVDTVIEVLNNYTYLNETIITN